MARHVKSEAVTSAAAVYDLPSELQDLKERFDTVANGTVGDLAESVDTTANWPKHTFVALKQAGLMGLHCPKDLPGGMGLGMLALAIGTEALGKVCGSSAICYGMHCVGSATIAAKATEDHRERFLGPIAAGRHITTLALSEAGTGSQFYISETGLTRKNNHYVVDGAKHFVTNGGQADSYVLSTRAAERDEPGMFNMLVVEADRPGITWPTPWRGFGMRGNSSLGMRLRQVPVPLGNLLGSEGDEIWYVFEVVAPFFLVAMAGTYLGIASAALQIATEHVKSRSYSHSAERLVHNPVIQSEVGNLWRGVEKCRLLLYEACRRGDSGDSNALPYILAAKAEAGHTAVWATNTAMTLVGGIGYRENSRLGRLMRDARAAHVMAPTTHILEQWTGRAILGLPLI